MLLLGVIVYSGVRSELGRRRALLALSTFAGGAGCTLAEPVLELTGNPDADRTGLAALDRRAQDLAVGGIAVFPGTQVKYVAEVAERSGLDVHPVPATPAGLDDTEAPAEDGET